MRSARVRRRGLTVLFCFVLVLCRPAENGTHPGGDKQAARSNAAGLSAPRHPEEPRRFPVS